MLAPILLDRTFGVIGTIIETLYQLGLMKLVVQELSDSLMHGINIGLGELAARHPALVGHNDKSIAGASQLQQRLGSAVDEADQSRVAEVSAVGDERIISIKENCRFHRREDTRIRAVHPLLRGAAPWVSSGLPGRLGPCQEAMCRARSKEWNFHQTYYHPRLTSPHLLVVFCGYLVAEAGLDGSGGGDQRVINGHKALLARSQTDVHVAEFAVAHDDHPIAGAAHQQLNRVITKQRGEHTIIGNRRAAALDVTKNRRPRLDAASRLDLTGDALADAT